MSEADLYIFPQTHSSLRLSKAPSASWSPGPGTPRTTEPALPPSLPSANPSLGPGHPSVISWGVVYFSASSGSPMFILHLLSLDLDSRGLLDATLSVFNPYSMQQPERKYRWQHSQPCHTPAQNPPMAPHCPQDKVCSLAWHSRLFVICQSHRLISHCCSTDY